MKWRIDIDNALPFQLLYFGEFSQRKRNHQLVTMSQYESETKQKKQKSLSTNRAIKVQ
jgi:hypothetical protein